MCASLGTGLALGGGMLTVKDILVATELSECSDGAVPVLTVSGRAAVAA